MTERTNPGGAVLSERRREVLRRLISHYVRSVHPVSSQSIAQEMNVSSATVRNEMGQLKEQGLIRQPHTSGGSIPTDHAYRFLVEELLASLAVTLEHRGRVAGVYSELGREAEMMLEGTLDLLTETTGYVAWVSMPMDSVLNIKSINFVEADSHQLLIVLVTGSGIMQSRMIATDVPVRELNTGQLSDRLNNYLRNRSTAEIDYNELRKIFHETVEVPGKLVEAMREFFTGIAGGSDRVMFSNALQLVLQPEFSSVDNLANVMNALKDKDRFIRTLREQLNERRVQTIIGSENIDPSLHECSLVLSQFDTPAGREGTVGVLGPTRLLYERTLPWVRVIGETVAVTLNQMPRDEAGEQ